MLIKSLSIFSYFFFNDTATTEIYTLSLHDALPISFSHQHHAAGLGLDCRYCHTSVEESSFAGIPPTKTCMNCHSQIWTSAAMLETIRFSFNSGQSIQWTRVHVLPDFGYFNHILHAGQVVA